MQIRIKETGAVVFESELRGLYPNTSGPLDDLYDVVFEGPQATGGTVYQYSQAAGVEQIGDKWFTKYILGPVFTDRIATEDKPAQTAAEQEAFYKAVKDAEQSKSVRASRDSKLAESDWRVIKAVEMSTAVPIEWAAHRQALRDITSQAGFPWTITWPDAV